MAIQELKLSVISSTAVTLIVFVPMMMLPGIMGKFLAYIPITVFSSVLATLVLALTVNSSIFVRIVKPLKYFIRHPLVEDHLSADEKMLLDEERSEKEERPPESETVREKIIERFEGWYEKTLIWWLETQSRRRMAIW